MCYKFNWLPFLLPLAGIQSFKTQEKRTAKKKSFFLHKEDDNVSMLAVYKYNGSLSPAKSIKPNGTIFRLSM